MGVTRGPFIAGILLTFQKFVVFKRTNMEKYGTGSKFFGSVCGPPQGRIYKVLETGVGPNELCTAFFTDCRAFMEAVNEYSRNSLG